MLNSKFVNGSAYFHVDIFFGSCSVRDLVGFGGHTRLTCDMRTGPESRCMLAIRGMILKLEKMLPRK
jgi:hypothetical protein